MFKKGEELKRLTSYLLLALLLVSMFAFLFGVRSVKGITIIVPDDYPTIQGAVNAAFENDIIFVRNGTYGAVVVVKALSLIGESAQSTVIDGGGLASIVAIGANNVNISGFTIRNSGTNSAGIRLESAVHFNINITGNNITNNYVGIWLDSSSNCSVNRNNITTNIEYGVYLGFSSNYNTVTGNNITNNGYGFGFEYSSNCNIVTGNNITANTHDGITLDSSSNNSISGNSITANNQDGIGLDFSYNNTIFGNKIIANAFDGVWLGSSTNNTISENKMAENSRGIAIDSSSHNIISGNNITANSELGISLFASSDNILTDNAMSHNAYNFGVNGYVPLDFVNQVDASNTVEGKPVCYWVNQVNTTVPSDSGFVALVNCTGITVQNLHLTNNLEGIGLIYTNESMIAGNEVTKCGYGIALGYSRDNTVSGNNVTDNGYMGITLMLSLGNDISGNNIMGNSYGISTFGNSSDNMICHNSFVDNGVQADTDTLSINLWDNGVEGNYWSDYNGVDVNPHDGIGDSPYVIDANNQDNYPLMSSYIPGDYNHDGIVNMTDADMVRNAWQSEMGDFNYNSHVDFNQDGIIDISDAAILGLNWQKHA